MPKNSDNELVNELFKTYRQMMYKIALDILHNETDAENIIQDTFLWIINNLEKISQIPCHERGSYFASIIEHRAIDIYRRRSNHPIEDLEEQFDLSADERVDEAALSNVTVEVIKNAMNELSHRDYEMLVLYLFKEMSPKEISGAMGIPESNIRKYIERARKRLAKILREKGYDYDV
ncbi:MAG: sigma-70 family RNA polymerase sigma factor [Lachnospiraceae bacterium]|nr:sigma-70 family RNA polymerase sigma factor [Ruminococcus sp.]MCM1276801.1 sigma-70 family RNA polymerase sigma factor [Lachnospiraceae bacterium]